MASAPQSPDPLSAPYRGGTLPTRLKVLYVTTLHRTGGWLAEAFAADSATEILLEESVGATAGLARLRDEMFDAVLVSHEPGVLDAVRLIEGLRGGGADEPMIVLGSLPCHEMEAECFEVGADAYCFVEQTTTRSLLWNLSRAFQRCLLARENRRLAEAERQRLELEHREAERLLAQQRALIAEIETIRKGSVNAEHGGPPVDAGIALDAHRLPSTAEAATQSPRALPPPLVQHYREMLRTYVVMGHGNLANEMAKLADLLACAFVSARDAMQLHLHVLEELVAGLGNRSARHVLHRADLLVLEVMVHLADRYRARYLERHDPPQQLLLPGFDATALEVAHRAA